MERERAIKKCKEQIKNIVIIIIILFVRFSIVLSCMVVKHEEG